MPCVRYTTLEINAAATHLACCIANPYLWGIRTTGPDNIRRVSRASPQEALYSRDSVAQQSGERRSAAGHLPRPYQGGWFGSRTWLGVHAHNPATTEVGVVIFLDLGPGRRSPGKRTRPRAPFDTRSRPLERVLSNEQIVTCDRQPRAGPPPRLASRLMNKVRFSAEPVCNCWNRGGSSAVGRWSGGAGRDIRRADVQEKFRRPVLEGIRRSGLGSARADRSGGRVTTYRPDPTWLFTMPLHD